MADSAKNLPAVPTVSEWYDDVPRSIRTHVVVGLALLVATFGGFGAWAFGAPLAAAVIAQGTFVATGQNKVVQHLEGGIIKELLVDEGDVVAAGQPLVKLDETLARANKRELFLRRTRLEATVARLLAEYDGARELVFPADLRARSDDPEVATILDEQRLAFRARRSSLEKDVALLERNIDALDLRARGHSRQLEAFRTQVDIFEEEHGDKAHLYDKGLTRKSEMNALKRAMVEATGHIGRLEAEIAEIDQMRLKYEVQIEKTRSEYRQAALDELQLIQSELESVREKTRKAEDVLARSVVKAPVAGTVFRMHYHTPGGVIESGKAILEILPSQAPLIIETLIPRTEIDTVRVGQEATVRLIALNQRTTPVLKGEVFYVSADAIADTSQGAVQEVYVARVSLTPAEIARVDDFAPTPGMPVEIMIQTESRTFAEYLARPVMDSMTRAFREQ
jgi:HlyD family secretion protein